MSNAFFIGEFLLEMFKYRLQGDKTSQNLKTCRKMCQQRISTPLFLVRHTPSKLGCASRFLVEPAQRIFLVIHGDGCFSQLERVLRCRT